MAQNAVLIYPIVRLATFQRARRYGALGPACMFELLAHCVVPHGQYVSGHVMRADAGETRTRVYRLSMAAGVVPADQGLSAHNP